MNQSISVSSAATSVSLNQSYIIREYRYIHTIGKESLCLLQIDYALVYLEIWDRLVLTSCPGVKDAMILWISRSSLDQKQPNIGYLEIDENILSRT
jgi:hypothetical protein